MSEQSEVLDVLIIGAGISGIGAAYHLQANCPGKTYAILERRQQLGGTWDLFRYPGVRSDSDMYTLGYSFRPWTNPKAIADGDAILAYLKDTAAAYGIDRKIRYGRRVERVSWSSREALWTVEVAREGTGEIARVKCRFLFACAGYYDYDRGHSPDFPGRSRFAGEVVHPQGWTQDIDYAGKRVVIIGSGATAVTLVPELAKSAAHVTMLQRSPTYIVAGPSRDRLANWLGERFPAEHAYAITRCKNIAFGIATYWLCRARPKQVKKFMIGKARELLGDGYDVETHFTPDYDPWDQRVCLAPDGDFFKAIRSGRASVVTDHIERFTPSGLELRSGEQLEADLVVTATGLKLRFLGGVAVEVDGEQVELPETMAYKGMMCSGVPNMALAFGYTNASWTLKVDLVAEYVCRLIKHMDAGGYAYCCPRIGDPPPRPAALLDFSSGYIQRGAHLFPKQGAVAPWRLHQNYVLDRLALRRASLEDGVMRFEGAR